MPGLLRTLTLETPGRGLLDITDEVLDLVRASGVREGLCLLFLLHTSAGLVVQENADPSARGDLEAFFGKLAPDGDPAYSHRSEGPDDMSAHIRTALTCTSLSLAIQEGRVLLGRWQGLFLFEHRCRPQHRRLLVKIMAG